MVIKTHHNMKLPFMMEHYKIVEFIAIMQRSTDNFLLKLSVQTLLPIKEILFVSYF